MTYDSLSQHPVPPPKRGMSTGVKVALGCVLPTAIVLALVGGCAALVGGAANEVSKGISAAEADDKRALKEDVQMVSCAVGTDGFVKDVQAQVKITNNGGKRANYFVDGEFLAPDGSKVGELMARVENLAPGTSSTQPFTGLFTSEQLDGVKTGTCKILEVSRDEWLAAN